MGGPCPETQKRCVLADHEMVFVSGSEIIEMVEDAVAVTEADASPHFFRNVPGQFGLISLPGLIERRLGQRGCRGRGSERRTQQIAWWRRTAIVVLDEVSILRNAVGPEIKLLDQPETRSQMDGGLEIKHVGNAIFSGRFRAGEGEGVGPRDQAAEGLVQGRVRYRGAIRVRSKHVHSR